MIKRLLRRYKRQTFSLRIGVADCFSLNPSDFTTIKEIIADKNSVIINADPFLYANGDFIYLFYEEKKVKTPGIIKMAKSRDLSNWITPVAVLEENFHLSFPFVFNDCGNNYMIPESNDAQSIRLYISDDNLVEWKLERIILQGEKYRDSSIVVKDGVFYLFTTVMQHNKFALKLFYADTLESRWVEHPASPLAVGMNTGRNGGSIICDSNRLFRPIQKSQNYYGEGLSIAEITVLSRCAYSERILENNVFSKAGSFYKHGGHHLSIVKFKDKYCMATDRVAYLYVFDSFCNGVKRDLKKILRQLLGQIHNG